MANLRIIPNIDFDTATLSSSPACVTNAPISNLQVGLRAKVARIATTGPWTISGTYPLAKTVSAVSVYKHNFTSIATMTLKLYYDSAMTVQTGGDYVATLGGVALQFGLAFQPAGWGNGGIVYGANTFESWPASYFTLWLPAQIDAVMGFKIIIADSGASSYLEAGRIYMGNYWSPAVNASYGAKMGWKEQSKQFRTDGGSLRTEGYNPFRSFALAFETLTGSERTDILNTFRRLGLRKDFFISVFPAAGGDLEKDYTAAVKFTAMPDIATPYYDNYTTDIQLEEV